VKIALIAGRFPVLSETFIYNHAAGLQAAGLDVTVVASRPKSDEAMFADFDGTRYTGPIHRNALGGGMSVAGRAASALLRSHGLELWEAARRRYGANRRGMRAWLQAAPLAGFDVVHFEYTGLAIRWLDALPLLKPAQTVVSCRGAAEQIRPLVEPRRADLLRQVFGTVDRVHCVSDDMRRTCEAYGLDPAKAFVNRPAIDAGRFVRKVPYEARASGPYRLLSTGRLHWKKGIEFALLAVRALVDRGFDVHYEILGGGEDEERLRFAIHDLQLAGHVSMVGRKSSSEVRAALERADVYVLPSVSEGLSNAALEAMAMELPVVAATAGGMAEAITDGVDGMLVPPRDPAAIADRVATLVQAPALRAALGRAARARVEHEFSLQRQVSVYLAEYAAMLGRAERAA
jgi:glycosyltransferase involved in cell wall biosynthesis